jgi:hypothetical protein
MVKRVPDTDPDLLCYLAEVGVVPQARFDVVSFSSFDENLKILVEAKEEPVVLGPAITCKVFVELIE